MSKIVTLFILLIISVPSFLVAQQHVFKVKADSASITNAELILENRTKDTSGFLFNRGNGRTEFRRALVPLNSNKYLIGNDTLNVSSGSTLSVAKLSDTSFSIIDALNQYPISFQVDGATLDSVPTQSSSNAISSGGVYTALQNATARGSSASSVQTFTNKTISLNNNTLTTTTAQLNAALTDNDIVTLTGPETLQNKNLTNGNTFPTFNQNTTGTSSNITGIVTGSNGGTGVANAGKTLTLGGSLTTSGAFTTTLTSTANTNITLPATGTLTSQISSVNLTSKTANIPSTTLFTPTVTGLYRIAVWIAISNTATTSSTLPSVSLSWTSGEVNGNVGMTSSATPTSTANSTTTYQQTTIIAYCKASTAISYSTTGYASSGSQVLNYSLRLKVEQL